MQIGSFGFGAAAALASDAPTVIKKYNFIIISEQSFEQAGIKSCSP
jgi:hypothetical protein